MTGFRQHRRSGLVVATFGAYEADLIRSLAAQLVELLHDGVALPDPDRDPLAAMLDLDGPVDEPEDPVLRRLLPSAHRDDQELAGEFRRFTEPGLRRAKAGTASTVVRTLEEAGLPPTVENGGLMIDVELDEAAAMDWVRAFTDVRLALAVRLGVEEDDDAYWASLDDDDPRAQAHDIYEWVGFLQETLVGAISAG